MAMKLSCAPVCPTAYRPYQLWQRLPLDPLVCLFVKQISQQQYPCYEWGNASNVADIPQWKVEHHVHLEERCIFQVLQ